MTDATAGGRGTLKLIARELGVSAKTVSNAFNRPDQLSPALRQRILATAAGFGYAGPDATARALRRGRAGMVGVLYDNPLSYAFADPAAAAVLGGISDGLDDQDYGLSLIAGSAGTARSAAGVNRAIVDGIIAYSLATEDAGLRAALDGHRPVVIIDQPRRDGTSWVGIDDELAAETLAATLVHAGHRRFGIVAFGLDAERAERVRTLATLPPVTYDVSARRLAGYQRALAPVCSPDMVPVAFGPDNTVTLGAARAGALLDRERLTALICLSDQLALGAIAAARARGQAVPADLTVAGFDGLAAASFATIHQPHRPKGQVAAQLLREALAGESPRQVTLPFEFVPASVDDVLRDMGLPAPLSLE